MVSNADNHAQVSNEETKMVDQLLIHCGVILQNFLDSYDNPKEYAKVILKIMSSKNKLALIRQLKIIKNKIAPNELVPPGEFNRQLAQDMIDPGSTETSGEEIEGYIDSRRLSENLEILRDDEHSHLNMRVLSKIQGKNEIKRHLKKHPAENKKGDIITNTFSSGGLPIADVISHEFEGLRKLMSTKEIVLRVYNGLKESGLLLKATKFQFLGELYATRMQQDEEKIKDYFKANLEDNPFFCADNLKDQLNKSGVRLFREYLLSLTDNQLEGLAEKTAVYLIGIPLNHNYFLSILFKPILKSNH